MKNALEGLKMDAFFHNVSFYHGFAVRVLFIEQKKTAKIPGATLS